MALIYREFSFADLILYSVSECIDSDTAGGTLSNCGDWNKVCFFKARRIIFFIVQVSAVAS